MKKGLTYHHNLKLALAFYIAGLFPANLVANSFWVDRSDLDPHSFIILFDNAAEEEETKSQNEAYPSKDVIRIYWFSFKFMVNCASFKIMLHYLIFFNSHHLEIPTPPPKIVPCLNV